MKDLTDFQKAILHVLAEESRYGLAVKEELDRYYDEDINHGRLYPNLDALVEKDYVDKRARDERTNLYHLTDHGERAVVDELGWKVGKYLQGADQPEDRLEEVLQKSGVSARIG